jgi:hypothetical protein
VLPAQQLCTGAPWIIRLADLRDDAVRRDAEARRSRRPISQNPLQLDVAGYCLAEQMRMAEMDIDSISRDAVVSGGSSGGRWGKEVRLDLLVQVIARTSCERELYWLSHRP